MTEQPKKLDCFVSVVSVLHNAEAVIEAFLRSAYAHLDSHFPDYEIVLINQRAEDGTIRTVESLLEEIPSIRLIELAAPVYEDIALAGGLENAIGDFVVLLRPGIDPPHCIADVVGQCARGSDVVVGTAENQPQSMGYRLIRPCIQWVLKSIGYTIPRNATTLRCLSRRAVNAVTQTGRFHHQFFVRIAATGYPCSTYEYTLESPAATTRTLRNGIRQTLRLLVFNSTKPLRWMSSLGIMGSALAFMFALYSLLIHLIKRNVVEGWTSLVLFMSVMFGLLFTIMAFFGEYLSRLLDDRSEHRDYSVVYEKSSSVMINEQRRNVLDESGSRELDPVPTERDG